LNGPGTAPDGGVGTSGVEVHVEVGVGEGPGKIIVAVEVGVRVGVWVFTGGGVVAIGPVPGRKLHQAPVSANVAPELFTAWTCQ